MIHGQSEQDSRDDDRQEGDDDADLRNNREVGSPTPAEDDPHDAHVRVQRQQAPEGRSRGNDDGAEDHHEEGEREVHHHGAEEDEGDIELLGDADRDSSLTGDHDIAEPIAALIVTDVGADIAHKLHHGGIGLRFLRAESNKDKGPVFVESGQGDSLDVVEPGEVIGQALNRGD